MNQARIEGAVGRPPLTTLTVFGFAGAARLWALLEWGRARSRLRGQPGLRFYRLLLAGGHGLHFTVLPDLRRFVLLAVWDDPAGAQRFYARSSFMRRYRRHAARTTTLWLRPLFAQGTWSGTNPFLPTAPAQAQAAAPLAVLTRSGVRPRWIVPFVARLPAVTAALRAAPGLHTAIGLEEPTFPIGASTFSVWDRRAPMQVFAYQEPAHAGAIRDAQDEHWYAEFLHARFAVLDPRDLDR